MLPDMYKVGVVTVQKELMDNIKKNVCGVKCLKAFTVTPQKFVTIEKVMNIYETQIEGYCMLECMVSDAKEIYKYLLPISVETLEIISMHIIPLKVTREFEIVPNPLGQEFLEKL